MERPTRFEHSRWLGDKRTQVVYDVDTHRRSGHHRRADGQRDLPELRARHPGRGPQPGLPALPGRRLGHHRRTARLAGRRPPGMEQLFTSTGDVGIWGHLARPAAPRARGSPGWSSCHGFPERAGWRTALGQVVPRAGRPHRHRTGLGRARDLLPGLRRTPRGTSRCGAGWTTCTRPATTCTRSTTWVGCGWPGSVPAARSRSAPRPTTPGSGGWPPWAHRPTSTTGPATLVGCCCTPATSASCGPDLPAGLRRLVARAARDPGGGRRAAGSAAAAADHARLRRRVGAGVRRPGAGRRPRRGRAAHHRRGRPPAAPRPPRRRRAARLARPPTQRTRAAGVLGSVGLALALGLLRLLELPHLRQRLGGADVGHRAGLASENGAAAASQPAGRLPSRLARMATKILAFSSP